MQSAFDYALPVVSSCRLCFSAADGPADVMLKHNLQLFLFSNGLPRAAGYRQGAVGVWLSTSTGSPALTAET